MVFEYQIFGELTRNLDLFTRFHPKNASFCARDDLKDLGVSIIVRVTMNDLQIFYFLSYENWPNFLVRNALFWKFQSITKELLT